MDNKKKLILAVALLVVSAGILTWHFTRSRGPGPVTTIEPIASEPEPEETGANPVRRRDGSDSDTPGNKKVGPSARSVGGG